MKLHGISWVILLLTVTALIFYSSWFFLGSEESYNNLKDELLKSLVLRAATFSLIATPSVIIISIIEYFQFLEPNRILKLLKKVSIVIAVLVLSSLIGNIIFFIH